MSTLPTRLAVETPAEPRANGVPAWKHELNDRLQATRTRHIRKTMEHAEQPSLPSLEHMAKPETRASRLAAKVAQRYANAPSYSEILAAEARAAARAAEAAAMAARQVCAAVEAMENARVQEASPSLSPSEKSFGNAAAGRGAPIAIADLLEESLVSPAEPLPVNLIEFPRELVATRRVRPRLAEGPLRESSEEMAHDQSQLRIFEVEPESISKAMELEAAAPEWAPIRLDSKPASMSRDEKLSTTPKSLLEAAPLEDRLMAGIVDAALVSLAFVLFVLVSAACTAHVPTGKPTLISAAFVMGGLFLLYQYIFFRFADGTPGMRYAKIALCTLDDENPTRKAMRQRILFLLLSAAPFLMGFAWAWFDTDRLGWHDRLSRMYQRSYR